MYNNYATIPVHISTLRTLPVFGAEQSPGLICSLLSNLRPEFFLLPRTRLSCVLSLHFAPMAVCATSIVYVLATGKGQKNVHITPTDNNLGQCTGRSRRKIQDEDCLSVCKKGNASLLAIRTNPVVCALDKTAHIITETLP